MEVYAIAAVFNVPRLKSMYERKILQQIKELNTLEVFNLGQAHDSIKLKRKAFDIIRQMFPELILEDYLMDQADALKNLLAAKEERDKMIEIAYHSFDRNTNNVKCQRV